MNKYEEVWKGLKKYEQVWKWTVDSVENLQRKFGKNQETLENVIKSTDLHNSALIRPLDELLV